MTEVPLPVLPQIELAEVQIDLDKIAQRITGESSDEEEESTEEEVTQDPAERSDQLANCHICPYNEPRSIIHSQETMETLASPPLEICMLVFPTDTQKSLMEEKKIATKCPYQYDLSLRKTLDEIKKVIDIQIIQFEGTAPATGHQPPNFPRAPLIDLIIVNVDAAQALLVKLEKGNNTTIAVGGTLALGTINGFGLRYELEDIVFVGVGGAADYELVALKPIERTLGELMAEDVPDEERSPPRGA